MSFNCDHQCSSNCRKSGCHCECGEFHKHSYFTNKMTYDEVKEMMLLARHVIIDMLDLALDFDEISQKERDVLYRRLIDWQSLQEVGKVFGVTRERIRQIEAKGEERLRYLTKKRS